MLKMDLSMNDSELGSLVAAVCTQAGAVRSVKIHRGARPFALVEMATNEGTYELAARYERSAFGTSVLLYLEHSRQPNRAHT